jgi:hypothetical protein
MRCRPFVHRVIELYLGSPTALNSYLAAVPAPCRSCLRSIAENELPINSYLCAVGFELVKELVVFFLAVVIDENVYG